MPVAKYRHVEQMPPTPRAGDGELAARITTLWRRARRFAPLSVVSGVRRFRTIEEANAARDDETVRRLRKLRAESAR